MVKKWLPRIFFIFCVLFFAACFFKAKLSPEELVESENRKANLIAPFSFSGYIDGTFQESMDAGLADQMLYAEEGKAGYNNLTANYLLSVMDLICGPTGYYDSKYINFMDINTFKRNYLVYSPRTMEELQSYIDERVKNINDVVSKNPDTEFYMYFIEKDTDINFETGGKGGFFPYVSKNVTIPEKNQICFEVNSFDDFSSCFYRTDHHWNCDGSYKGYRQLAELFGFDDIIEPLERVFVSDGFSGSKATTSRAETVYKEDFYAYVFDYPKMKITINGSKCDDYGLQKEYIEGKAEEKITYGNFYGGDDGEIIFDTENEDKENILVIGESFDNAILKLLASHFNKTFSIDLRNYNYYMGQDFNISEYIEKNEIDKVLFIGNLDYFVSEEFALEV